MVRSNIERPTGGQARRLGHLVTEGIEASLDSYPDGLVLEEHAHRRDNLIFVARGHFLERFGRQKVLDCKSGEMLAKRATTAHRDEFPAPCVAINVEIEAWRRDELEASGLRIGAVSKIATSRTGALGYQLYDELESPDDLSPMVAGAIAIGLMAEGSRAASRSERGRSADRLALEVVEILEETFPRPPGLHEIARTLQTRAATLSRHFQDATGRTIGQFAREMRIARAREMIADGTASLGAIAQATGFSDQSHLTRAFRRAIGRTPAEFARSMRGIEPRDD